VAIVNVAASMWPLSVIDVGVVDMGVVDAGVVDVWGCRCGAFGLAIEVDVAWSSSTWGGHPRCGVVMVMVVVVDVTCLTWRGGQRGMAGVVVLIDLISDLAWLWVSIRKGVERGVGTHLGRPC
jgi:hypothetical protein